MDIAVIGASGTVGHEIAHLVVAERLLDRDQRLVLVGHEEGRSAESLYGFAADLTDAYAEVCPKLEVVLQPEAVKAELIIMAGGATISTDLAENALSRDSLAVNNFPIFSAYAAALAQQGNGSEIVICISNPNELAVAVFARYLGRRRVIGMGAFLDTLRFRAEVAADLGIRRQSIHGFMAGEHGQNTVPLWSNVHVYGLEGAAFRDSLARIRKGHTLACFQEDVKKAMTDLNVLIAEGRIRTAYEYISQYPPDIRVVLKPFITHFSGAKTVTGTARATMELIRMITLGSDALVAGQICLEGEFYGIHSTIGVPFVIGNRGVDRIIEIEMDESEKKLLVECAEKVQKKIRAFL